MWRQALTIKNDSPSRTSVDGWIRSECLSEQARDKPGPAPLPHRTGGSLRATEERQPPRSHARKSARVRLSCLHQDDSKVLHKEETERKHESTELNGHETDRSVAERQHSRDNGIRSQKETVVFDNSFLLHRAAKKESLASLTMRSQSGPGNP